METEQQLRYDSKLAQEALVLAARLQDEQRDTMTVEQIEAVAQEVGVEPHFVAEALRQLQANHQQATHPKGLLTKWQKFGADAQQERERKRAERGKNLQTGWTKFRQINPGLWWAVGWLLPGAAAILTDQMPHAVGNTVGPLSGLIYVGGGIFLSITYKSTKEALQQMQVAPVQGTVSREELLQTLFAAQQQLQAGKRQRAFLSIDVVGSTQMKRNGSELEVEYSFLQYQHWVEAKVHTLGGQVQSAAGDGMMCVFEQEETALTVAQSLLEDLPRFNQEQNLLSTPFQIRCGVSVGEVAIEPGQSIGQLQSPVIDLAAKVQKEAPPNTVQVGRAR